MRDFKESVVYEIYIRSFKDSDGDGTGDLRGIIEKLDYLKELGVDYLWITPFYVSPLVDNGYDVADYRNIDPKFGKMQDLEELIIKAKERDIGIMLDMVFNHSSTEHEWFKKAKAGEKKYQDYYILKESSTEPTNWLSKFGGNVWERFDEKRWYLHLFDKTQADLNWENPDLREEIFEIIRYWMDKGVQGFRFDVINLISKPDEYLDATEDDGRSFYTDGPRIHEYLQLMNRESFGRDPSLMTVGEMSSTSLENCLLYSREDGSELSMTFSFHHLKVDYEKGNKWTLMKPDLLKLKELLSTWQVGMAQGGGWNAVFLNNHDQPRSVSRFGSLAYHYESATMLATLIHCLRGTPYLFQGEEYGQPNAGFQGISEYNDVESKNYFEILKDEGKSEAEALEILRAKSRDNARCPMQWDDSPKAGFTEGTPWISFSHYPQINSEADRLAPRSIFRFYQKLIALRHEDPVIARGDFEEIYEGSPDYYIYRRAYQGEERLILLNLVDQKVTLPSELDLSNYKTILSNVEAGEKGYLKPFEARILTKI